MIIKNVVIVTLKIYAVVKMIVFNVRQKV
jgi:hypothetical protein